MLMQTRQKTETLGLKNVCDCGEALANGVAVAPAWGPEVRFPVPIEMLNAASYVSNPSTGGEEGKEADPET